MKIYRITASKYSDDLSGTGARLYGGRWNNKGTPLLYCSQNVSLAILEILVHFDGLTVPLDLRLLQLEIDEKLIETYPTSKFTKIKKSKDAEFQFKKEGQNWIEKCNQLALNVPSIISPYEYNILINPIHPDFKQVVILKNEKLDLDNRLFKM